MTLLLFVLIAVVLTFGFVVLFGAPYLPTLKTQQKEALELLNLKPGQTLVELGSGDGRMLIAAAKLDVYAIGYELNPLLWLYSWLITRKYRHFVTVKLANFWSVTLPECDGIYVFLLERFMTRLHNKITQEITKPVKVVSFAFPIPDKQKASEEQGLFLYMYKPQQ